MKTFEQVLDEKLAECRELMIRKQRDYGSDNISAWGELGVAVRLTDKVARPQPPAPGEGAEQRKPARDRRRHR